MIKNILDSSKDVKLIPGWPDSAGYVFDSTLFHGLPCVWEFQIDPDSRAFWCRQVMVSLSGKTT
jgi:hypothetical protein